MTQRLHLAVLATTLLAISAVGLTGASAIAESIVSTKGDRLAVAAPADESFTTVEERLDGVSILIRVPNKAS